MIGQFEIAAKSADQVVRHIAINVCYSKKEIVLIKTFLFEIMGQSDNFYIS